MFGTFHARVTRELCKGWSCVKSSVASTRKVFGVILRGGGDGRKRCSEYLVRLSSFLVEVCSRRNLLLSKK